MPSLTQRLRPFQRLSAPARRAGLIDALRYADADELMIFVNELVVNPSIEGYLILLERYYQIDSPARHKILQGGSNLSAALTRATHSDNPQARRTALQIIETREDKRCIHALAAILRRTDETSENLARAALILRMFAELLTDSVIPDPTERRTFEQLDTAVAGSLETYPAHRQPEVLLAAAILAQAPGPALTTFLNDHDHPAHFALRGVLKKFDNGFIAESALQWLNLDHLAPQLRDRLAQLARTPELAKILQSIHLVHLPTVQARLQRLNARYPSSLPLGQAVQILDAETQAKLPQWLSTIPLSPPDRIAHLGEALCFQTPAARLAALRALRGIRSPEADAMIESFCFDEDETIARIALRHCLRVYPHHQLLTNDPNGTALFTRLAASPHPSVRKLIATTSRIETFAEWWELSLQINHFKNPAASPSSTASAAAESLESMQARQALGSCFLRSFHRSELADALRDHLLINDHTIRKLTVALIRRFHLAEFVELELLALATENDSQLTSEIITIISAVQSDATHDVLWAALQHPNNRVRANAIESLQQRTDVNPDSWQTIINTRIVSDDNRIRANALCALNKIDPAESERQLKIMLEDARPLHRISALWASAHTRQLGCAQQIARLAEADEMQPIRKRAQRTAAQLLGHRAAQRLIQNRIVKINLPEAENSPNPPTTKSPTSQLPRATLVTTITALLATTLASAVNFAQPQNDSNNETTGGRLAEISDAFVGRTPNLESTATPADNPWVWLAGLLGTATIIALMTLAYKIQRTDQQNFGPDYRTLARELKLNFLDSILLNRLAHAVGLRNGIGLLISRGTFQHHLENCLATDSAIPHTLLKKFLRTRAAGIRQQLFD